MRKWFIIIPLVLILLLLCGAITATALFAVRGISSSGIRMPSFGTMNFSVEEEAEQRFPVNSPAKLTIKNFAGRVSIVTGQDDEIVVRSKKTANGYNQQSAQDNLKRLNIKMTPDANSLDIQVQLEQREISWGGSVDFTVTVPEKTEVQVNSETGDLSLEGTSGPVDLNTSFGAIEVTNVKNGAVKVTSRNGRIQARGVQAGSQPVELRSDFGDVSLATAAGGTLTIQTNNGTVSLENVKASGKVDLHSDFGRIEYKSGSSTELQIQNQNGEVAVSDVKASGDLVISSDFGAIRLVSVDAKSYNLKTLNGRISVDGVTGSIKAVSDFGDVEIKNGRETTLDLKSGNGAVRFEGNLGPGPHTLRSDFGAITLSLPGDQAFNFDLQTDFGKIRSDFEMTVQGTADEKHLQGKVNGGGDSVTVITKNGNITLENSAE